MALPARILWALLLEDLLHAAELIEVIPFAAALAQQDKLAAAIINYAAKEYLPVIVVAEIAKIVEPNIIIEPAKIVVVEIVIKVVTVIPVAIGKRCPADA